MSLIKESARVTRVEVYSDWLADDVDGLIHNVKPPFSERCPQATAILADAREKVALALSKLDQAIAQDRDAHAEMETV